MILSFKQLFWLWTLVTLKWNQQDLNSRTFVNYGHSLRMKFSISNTDFHLFVGLHCHFVAEIKTKLYFASPFDLFVLFCLQNETTDRKLVPTWEPAPVLRSSYFRIKFCQNVDQFSQFIEFQKQKSASVLLTTSWCFKQIEAKNAKTM